MVCAWHNYEHMSGTPDSPPGLSDTWDWAVGRHRAGAPSSGPSDDHTFNNTKGGDHHTHNVDFRFALPHASAYMVPGSS